MSNGHDKAEVSDAVETVIDKSASNKFEDEKSGLESVSELSSRAGIDNETCGESVKLEVNIDETRDLCIVNSVTKNIEEDKCPRVSKCRNDVKSVTVTEEDPCKSGENDLQGSDITKATRLARWRRQLRTP
jgi:hypothetical protein